MRNTLEDLYYGNISLNSKEVRKGSEYDTLSKDSIAARERLVDTLTDKQVEMLDEFSQAEAISNDMLFCEQFVCGFRLGAKLMLEALCKEDDGDFERIIK